MYTATVGWSVRECGENCIVLIMASVGVKGLAAAAAAAAPWSGCLPGVTGCRITPPPPSNPCFAFHTQPRKSKIAEERN